MSVRPLPNQPIQFDVSQDSCSCATLPYKQLINTDDVSQVQFEILPCLWNDNLVLDGGFTSDTNWTVTDSFTVDTANNQACKANGGIGTLTQYNVFAVDGYYIMQIVVDSITETAQVWQGGERIGTLDGVGLFTFSFKATGDFLSIRSFSSTNVMCITSISAYEIDSRLLIGIFSEDGTYQNGITLADDPDEFKFAKGTLTVSLDWTALSITAGCYYIGIADPCLNTNGQNGVGDTGLISANNWTETLNANSADSGFNLSELGTGYMYESDASGASAQANIVNNYITLLDGLSYDVTVRFQNGNTSHRARIKLGTASNTFTPTGAYDDVQTATIVCSGGTDLDIQFDSLSAVANLETLMDFIDIELTNLSDIDPNSESVALKVGTHACSVLINSNCNEDSFGFEFDTSLFNPRLRVEGELINATYPTVRNVIEDTQGNMRILYGERKKAYQLIIGLIPEYLIDYVTALPIFDNLWVDGTKYFVQEDGIDIEYPDGSANSGRMVLNLIEQSTILVNTNVSGVTNNSNLPIDGYIVDPRNSEIIITEPSTGDTVQAL